MTCIVAISDGNTVYMGGERGYSDEHVIIPSLEPKIYDKGLYLIGYAGNAGTGQNVVHNFNPPAFVTNTKVDNYMYRSFIPALRKFLKDDIDKDDDTSLIIGIKGRVYEISVQDYQCTEYKEIAIGSGMPYALGSLHTSKDLPAKERVHIAIESAITYSPTCQGPIDILYK